MSYPLPPGTFSWNPAASTLNFHDSAHGLVHQQARAHDDAPQIHLKLIGRDVLLVRDYRTAKWVFEEGERFSSRLAYSDLMMNYYPEPNIWFEDTTEANQAAHRDAWETFMAERLSGDAWTILESRVRGLVRHHQRAWPKGQRLDLYKIAKELAHDLFMDLFLGLNSVERDDRSQFALAGQLTTTMMRGQFSLPVGINVGFWKSPHAKGMDAKRRFEETVLRPQMNGGHCPFLQEKPPPSVRKLESRDQHSHTLMFASCMIEKSLASVLTTMLLQLYRHNGQLADALSHLEGSDRSNHLDAIYKENSRLCPASIGVMRRNRGAEFLLDVDPDRKPNQKVRVPAKWDVWLYFPDIMRDPAVYGSTATVFDATRFLQRAEDRPPDPLTFGAGPKTCLAKDLIRKLCFTVLEEVVWSSTSDARPSLEDVEALNESLQDFLGWRDVDKPPMQGWPGVKQLPIQRPRHPIWIRFDDR